ncbi:uncharacterized protein LOC102079388 isoform X6 [Oreochromis niloticus]|uniref:uncharacterized protein LOC102079388 isoform X6 n=1 Tax=Oreochromis niloticus TaxID=8128 RepID=UPI000DF1D87C|nr:uncharacterized protein LOC102079388 isoform X6 [Oreochromis niloticus]
MRNPGTLSRPAQLPRRHHLPQRQVAHLGSSRLLTDPYLRRNLSRVDERLRACWSQRNYNSHEAASQSQAPTAWLMSAPPERMWVTERNACSWAAPISPPRSISAEFRPTTS